jgi:acetyl-CoA carboxylase carboxyl transferase subunit alpha
MKSWEYKEIAEALKLTSSDMKRQKLVDDIIPEPLGGAHYDRDHFYNCGTVYHESI